MITIISYILGLLGAIGFFLTTYSERTKKTVGYGVNGFAQIPWVFFNISTDAYGLFLTNALTIYGCYRGLREMYQSPEAAKQREEDRKTKELRRQLDWELKEVRRCEDWDRKEERRRVDRVKQEERRRQDRKRKEERRRQAW
ncbi:hypothetical protein [Alkalihalobacillus sp. TS-13]|uniref:hypothetical protein n=1 Tax=Alkalihalobacillus sp. TS-13 TaxID=2842455 RepID=UPI001C885365|nr:hypothetical protein [Alkalihalobacillus sp. TS-13]